MNLREQTERMEKKNLSPHALCSQDSRGRVKFEQHCSVRTAFQRDRDRIIHSKSFRRLKQKTQVFIAPGGDHYRTRLTHTLEVSQIARTAAKALRLNEDLTEAIALGHDIGHTPFGHAGESALNEIFPGGFSHNEQSLRVVARLENGRGLNLTQEVQDGILHHTGSVQPETLEGQVVKIADRIAYINHDIDDAIRGGVISESSLPPECIAVLGNSHRERINAMVIDLINSSWECPVIGMSHRMQATVDHLREFLFKRVYTSFKAIQEEKKAHHVVQHLYMYFINNPVQLPGEYYSLCGFENVERVVCDYIAGMTDRYAIATFEKLFIPQSFSMPEKVYS